MTLCPTCQDGELCPRCGWCMNMNCEDNAGPCPQPEEPTTVRIMQHRLTRPDGEVLAWITAPEGAILDGWGPIDGQRFYVNVGVVPSVMLPPWRCEQRFIPDGEWQLVVESGPG
jgi:hypothetical protein